MPKSFLGQANLPIGLRNNNPGNLRPGIDWQGATGTNGGFLVFKDIAWGIRAMATDIGNDIRLDKKDTLTKLIYEYAPPSENDTMAYIRAVAADTGIAPEAVIQPTRENLKKIVRAQMNHELGRGYSSMITDADIDEGLALMNSGLLSFFKSAKESVQETVQQVSVTVQETVSKAVDYSKAYPLRTVSIGLGVSGVLLLLFALFFKSFFKRLN